MDREAIFPRLVSDRGDNPVKIRIFCGKLLKNTRFSAKKRLTHQIQCYIMYNCDVRRKCCSQSPGDRILPYMLSNKIIEIMGISQEVDQ